MFLHELENERKRIIAFTTTKTDLPLEMQRSLLEKDAPELKAVLWKNIYRLIATKLAISEEQLVFAKQTHSANIRLVESKNNGHPFSDTDGLVTQMKGICLCIQTADCTPILLFDPVNEIVAAVHAGWRGTAKNITGNAVLLMKEKHGTDPNHVIAYIGPCISQEIYEVGYDVYEAFDAIGLASEKVFKEGNIPEKFYCNLIQANRELLLRQGLLLGNIKTDNQCTYLQKELYYSARRDGGKTGRIISGIMMVE